MEVCRLADQLTCTA